MKPSPCFHGSRAASKHARARPTLIAQDSLSTPAPLPTTRAGPSPTLWECEPAHSTSPPSEMRTSTGARMRPRLSRGMLAFAPHGSHLHPPPHPPPSASHLHPRCRLQRCMPGSAHTIPASGTHAGVALRRDRPSASSRQLLAITLRPPFAPSPPSWHVHANCLSPLPPSNGSELS